MSVSLDVQKPSDYTPTALYDVVVVGAGPYGLSAAAHLNEQGLKVAIFGRPLSFWREHMPQGMLLRSYWWATNLSDPQGRSSFERYFQTHGIEARDPLPMETFINYGLWFQKRAVPNLDETYVNTVERMDDYFRVSLADGREIHAHSVVMAPGLQYYAHHPKEYAHMPSSLVSHTADHRFLDAFAGKHVAVIGRGQAALETAALLHEHGATARIIARQPIRWIPLADTRIPSVLRELRAPQAGMGSGWLNLVLEKYPYLLQSAPRSTRDYILTTRHGPAGSPWLKERVLNNVIVHENENVERIEAIGEQARFTLSSGKALNVDHVLLGTGYHADLYRLPMLDPSLLVKIRSYTGSPLLNNNFESSIANLYFVGYSAARSFGPFYRFVIGNEAAARRVAKAVKDRIALTR